MFYCEFVILIASFTVFYLLIDNTEQLWIANENCLFHTSVHIARRVDVDYMEKIS